MFSILATGVDGFWKQPSLLTVETDLTLPKVVNE